MIASRHVTLEECAICDQTVQFGPYRYEGAPLSGYEVFACYCCINTHRDGFGGIQAARLLKVLDDAGIAHPRMNDKGRLPLEF